MAQIKYTTADGVEHSGKLSMAEYYIYAHNADLEPTDRVPYASWDCTDYEPFKRAIANKYGVEVVEAKITRR